MSYSSVVLADNPVLYWRLEETSGSFVESGSLSGAITNGTGLTRNQTGIPSGGKGVLFTNSTTGQSKIGKALPFSYLNANYSTEVWVKTSKTDATIWMYAVSPFGYVNTTATGKASYSHVDGTPLTGTTTITNNAWHQIVTTYNHSLRQAKLYVDGALEGTVTVPNTNFATNANFGLSEERSNTFAMSGTMDEFSFYDKVLSAADVTAHYNAGISTTFHASFTTTPATGAGTAPDPFIDLRTLIEGTLFTDNFAGADNSGLGANWVTSGSATIQSNRARLNTTTPYGSAKATTSDTHGEMYDGEVLLKANRGLGNHDDVMYYLSPVADNPAPAANGSGFSFQNAVWVQAALTGSLNPGRFLTLFSARNGVVTQGPTVTMSVEIGTDIAPRMFRLRKVGNFFYVKTWVASASEPGAWDAAWNMGGNAPDLSSIMRPFFGIRSLRNVTATYYIDIDDVTVNKIEYGVHRSQAPAALVGSGQVNDPLMALDLAVLAAAFAGTATMPNPFTRLEETIVATPATGSGMMQEARIPLSAVTSVSEDREAGGNGAQAWAYMDYLATALFKFSLPTNVEITSVTLWLTKTAGSNAGTFEARRITSAWDEGGSTTPTIDSTVIGSAPFSAGNPNFVGIRITDVAAWNDGAPQHGVAVNPTGMPMWSGVVVATREEAESSLRPYVTYEYVPLSAIKVRPTPAEGTGLMQYREVFTGTPEIYNSWIDMNARRSDTPGSEYTHSWLPKIQITSNGAGLVVEASQLHKSRWDFPFNANLGTAKLLLRMHRPTNWDPAPPGATTRMTVRLVTTPWDWDDTSSITAETIGPVISVQDVLVEGEEYRELDITDAVQMWLTGTPNHGVYVTASGYSMAYFSLAFEGDEREGEPSLGWQDRTWPRILMEAYETGDINVRTYPIRGSGLMRDGKLPVPNVTVPAERAQAFATMPGGLFTSPAIITPNAITGEGIVNDVTLTLDVNGLSEPKPFVGTSYAVDPDEARRDEDDPYFRRIVATTDNDDIWFRLDEQSGTKVIQRIGGSGAILPDDINPQANWNIAPKHGINGPVGRRSVRLNGTQFIERHVTTTLAFPNPGLINAGSEYGFETVIRTTQKDSTLFYGHDPRPVGQGSYQNYLWIENGRITLWGPGNHTEHAPKVTGNANIADGNWHHIVVSWRNGDERNMDTGLRIYVDGKLDVRRRHVGDPSVLATPDWWFGTPSSIRDSPGSAIKPNFIGDVMEMVYRYRMDVGNHEIQRLYYDAMGIIPIEAAPFRATGEMLDAKGKGNQKRMLMLYFNTSHWYSGTPDTEERARGIFEYPGDFEFGIRIPTPGSPGYDDMWRTFGLPPQFFASGMRIFFQPIDLEGDYFRDPVTDLPRLLDLEHDIDVTDFDIIIYKNWPDEGRFELDRIKDIYGTTEVLDEHLDSLRRVIDKHGISLWVSNPTLAVKMGVISTAEVIPTMIDRAPSLSELAAAGGGTGIPQYGQNQVNKYEDHGPHVDPWLLDENGKSTYPDRMGGHGVGRYDTYRNNRERIVANVPGMTDALRWRFIEEYQIWSRFNHMGLDLDFQYKLGDRRNKVDQNGNITEHGGMRLGDEYVSPHLFQSDLSIHSHSMTKSEQFRTHTWAAPPGSVMAGTVVTKFGANVWVNGNVQIPNPYADYAGTIIVQPGDALKGKPVGGKILVTLSNDPLHALFGSLDWVGQGDGGLGGEDNLYMQDVPPDEELIERFGGTQRETPATREWQYSTVRLNVGFDPRGLIAGSSQDVTPIQNADGTVSYRTNSGGQYGGNGLTSLLISEKYPLIQTKVFTIVKAGIKWLQEKMPYVPGQRTVRVLALPGQGEMPKPTVNAGRSVQVVVPDAGLANAQMRTPDGYDEDIVIQAFPFVGSARITNYVRFVVVGPAYGYGNMPTVGDITAAKEGITLFLHRPDSIILYLEEL